MSVLHGFKHIFHSRRAGIELYIDALGRCANLNGRVIEIVLIETAHSDRLGGSSFLELAGKSHSMSSVESGLCRVATGDELVETASLETALGSSFYRESDRATPFVGSRGSKTREEERRKEDGTVEIHNALDMSLNKTSI
jgi:hypothetical protein